MSIPLLAEARTLIQEGLLGTRLVWNLPSFLKAPIHPEQAKTIIKKRLEERSNSFLCLVKGCVYNQPQSPYLKLLKMAGCEYGDLERLVHREGLDGALHRLFKEGIYLTSQEFNGRKKVQRGTTEFEINPVALMNPLGRKHIPVRSSGSRSNGTPVMMDLAYIRDCAVSTILYLEARNSIDSAKANWEVPGGFALFRLLSLNCSGQAPAHWFSQLDPQAQNLNFRYKASGWILKIAGFVTRSAMPSPQYVSLEDPLPIVHWMQDCVRNGTTPHLFTFSSSAVRLSRRALDAGIDLLGTQITMAGEPITEARLNTVRSSGAEAMPAMGSAECGHIGYGCLSPYAPDDLHFLEDLHAVIQPGEVPEMVGIKSRSLLLTSLRPLSPLFMLNVSLGDQAELVNRKCGCPLGEIGLNTHYQYIRSYEKLTSGGMAFFDSDVVRILEEVLPDRFGGAPTDYQLQENEDQEGRPSLKLVVHPRIGTLKDDEIKQTFLKAIATGPGAEKLTSLIWSTGDMLHVERNLPRTTATGKIQHMHASQKKKIS